MLLCTVTHVILPTLYDRYYHHPHFIYEKTEAQKVKQGAPEPGSKPVNSGSGVQAQHQHTLLHGSPASPSTCAEQGTVPPLPREAWLRCAPISKPFWVSVRCSYTVWFLGRLWKRNSWTQAHTCRINESPTLTIAVFVRLFLRYLWGFVRAPAVLVTTETCQQNIFIGIHLAKPQCLLCVITDHKMAEDQLLYLRAFVLKEKEYESQRASD